MGMARQVILVTILYQARAFVNEITPVAAFWAPFCQFLALTCQPVLATASLGPLPMRPGLRRVMRYRT